MSNKTLIVLTGIMLLSLSGCLRSNVHYRPSRQVYYYETDHHRDVIVRDNYIPSRLVSPCQVIPRLSRRGRIYPHQVTPRHIRGRGSRDSHPVQRHSGRIHKKRGK